MVKGTEDRAFLPSELAVTEMEAELAPRAIIKGDITTVTEVVLDLV